MHRADMAHVLGNTLGTIGTERQSYLIILRFNMDDNENPLRCGLIENDRLKRPTQARANFVVGIVDPSKRSVTTPILITPLQGAAFRGYDGILKHVERLNRMYRDEGGYVFDPTRFTQERKDEVVDLIRAIGNYIYGFLQGDSSNAVRDWLEDLFRAHEGGRVAADARAHHVTIVTNDFSIPWYWLNRNGQEPFLCEIASVGMLQLASYSDIGQQDTDPVWRRKVREENVYQALLINGSPELPFAEEELQAVATGLGRNLERRDIPSVKTLEVDSVEALTKARSECRRGQRLEQFRIVHFTGHYSSETLMLKGEPLDEREDLDKFIDRSLLVLDGCSSSTGVKAWTDLDTVTARLIRQGAAGCLVTVLPVKNDPIIGDVFWGAFYAGIRMTGCSVGEALRRARCALKERLDEMGASNPAWLMYQLVGNPSVEVFGEPKDRIEPR